MNYFTDNLPFLITLHMNQVTDTRRKWFLFDVFDIVAFLVFVIGIVLFVRFFVFNPFSVVGMSMHPTFEEWDFIIVDKITPNFWELKRWDVIVFVPPEKDVPYIKRIIWLPWETVKVWDNTINICASDGTCAPLDEKYLPADYITEPRCNKDTFEVEWGYFVMGDNRGHSTDSLCCFWFGCFKNANFVVPDDHIIGKVFVRLFPSFQSAFDTYTTTVVTQPE